MGISRRGVLGGIGHSATLGALVSLAGPLRAAQPAAAAAPAPAAAPAAPATTYCLTRIYRQSEGVTFNADLFRDKHLPLMQKAYGKTADRIELRMPAPVAEGAPAPQIIATVNVWFRDVGKFVQQNTAATKELAASMESVTKALAVEQVDQVVASLGEDRLTIPLETYCYSSYFPAREGGTFDQKYFAETLYPKMAELYGADAIRRIEMTSAATGKPQVLSAAHIYIKDETLYDAAAAKAGPELFAEVKTYTNIAPLQVLTRLHSAG